MSEPQTIFTKEQKWVELSVTPHSGLPDCVVRGHSRLRRLHYLIRCQFKVPFLLYKRGDFWEIPVLVPCNGVEIIRPVGSLIQYHTEVITDLRHYFEIENALATEKLVIYFSSLSNLKMRKVTQTVSQTKLIVQK